MSHRARVLAAILLVFAGARAGAEPRGELAAWGESLALDPRVVAEMERFDGDWSEGYARELATAVRRLIFQKTADQLALLEEEGCAGFIDVGFARAGFAARGEEPEAKEEREFEKGFVTIECLACFATEGTTAREALRQYTAPDFRMMVSSRIERIFEEEGLSCVETNGVRAVVRQSLACNLIEELHLPGLSSQHSQVVSGGDADSYQTVYFKESLKTFVEIPGGLAVHYVNYTRAKKFGRVKRLLGKGKIASSQKRAFQELRALLEPETD